MPEAKRRPGLRDWLGPEHDDWPSIDTLEDGAAFVGCYYLAELAELRTRSDKPYLRLQLCDRNGIVDGRVWDDTERVTATVDPGCFVGVRGRVQIYKGTRQLKVEEIRPIDVRPDEKALFMPRSPRDQAAMEEELDAIVAGIADAPLRRLLERLVGPETELGRRFRYAPAAKRNHHAYVGGLLEHTLSVTGLCLRLAEHYGDAVDRDLLVAGALVHDIGKVEEISAETGFPYTDEGKLLGHILLGLRMVEEAAADVPELPRARLVLLMHLVASHQGRYEWQSPREPRTLEALVLHYADDLDAKMNQAMARVFEVDEGWTEYDRSFGRDFFRHGGDSSAAGTGDERTDGADEEAVDAGTHARADDAGAAGDAVPAGRTDASGEAGDRAPDEHGDDRPQDADAGRTARPRRRAPAGEMREDDAGRGSPPSGAADASLDLFQE